MQTPNKSNLDQKSTEAEAHIKSAHQILKALQKKIGEQWNLIHIKAPEKRPTYYQLRSRNVLANLPE